MQGTMMGFLTSAGSLARGMGPLLITLLYQHKGPEITFATVVGLIVFTIIVFLIFYRRIVPYKPGPSYKAIT
jgi:ceroid-lipofuscinosis MFS transporter 7